LAIHLLGSASLQITCLFVALASQLSAWYFSWFVQYFVCLLLYPASWLLGESLCISKQSVTDIHVNRMAS
jgi:hypothetical protein